MDNNEYFTYLKQRSWLAYLYRNHILYPRLIKRLPGRMLDIGCGIGDMLAFHPNSFGVDINLRNVAYCQQRGLNACLVDSDSFPFADQTFDSALMDNVIEHIENPVPILLDIKRVIRPEGILLVGIPGMCGYYSDPDHKVFYNEETMVRFLNQFDFKLKEIFFSPCVRSSYLDRFLRHYCIYGCFVSGN